MGFAQNVRNALTSLATPDKIPSAAAAAMVHREMGRVGKANVKMFRNWSEHSEFVRAAINTRKNQVGNAEWDIASHDPDGRAPDTGLIRAIRERLEFANPKTENFQTFIEKVVEDILVLDAGSIEKVGSYNGEPLYVYDVDGGTIRVNAFWDGEDPDEARYYWYPDNFERASWRNDEFIYIMETPRTNSPVGLSKLETLKLTIDSELEGHAFNARQVRNPAPNGLLNLGKGARQENIDSFKAYWASEQGRGGSMAITGGTESPAFIKFHDSNKDAQFLEWQIYLVRKIAAVFAMNLQDLNVAMDVNRATAEVQDQQTEDRGIRPLLSLIAKHLTREFVWSPGFGGQANNLAFKFTKLNLKASLTQAQIEQIRTGGMPTQTVNQARIERGEEPLGPEFDRLMVMTPQTALAIDDVPSVREFMDSKKPVPRVGPGGPPNGE